MKKRSLAAVAAAVAMVAAGPPGRLRQLGHEHRPAVRPGRHRHRLGIPRPGYLRQQLHGPDAAAQHRPAQRGQAAHRGRGQRGRHGQRRTTGGLRRRGLAEHHGVRRRQPARQLRLVDRLGVNFWKSRGLPKAKTVLGVPFYSRPGYYTYAQIVAINPANANRDCVTVGGAQQCYNGLPTIRRKTQWAMANAGGIMNWELSQDATGRQLAGQRDLRRWPSAAPPRPPPRLRPTSRAGAPGGSPASPASASTSPPPARPTAPPCSCTTATAPRAQNWTVGTDGTIRGLGKCMDVAAAGTANGSLVQIYDCNGTGAQVWQAQSNGTLRNPASGRCLDASNNSLRQRHPAAASGTASPAPISAGLSPPPRDGPRRHGPRGSGPP